MSLQLFNTLGRQRHEFLPIDSRGVRLYSCGPTVYNYAHIGNLRAYVFVDLLRRTLEFLEYPVTHVMNVTDVGHLTDDGDDGEDKIEKRSRESGRSVWEIAEFYTGAFFGHTEMLNILPPHYAPRATDHIEQMIELIERLEARGLTYTAGGNVYYDISRFPGYGELARIDTDELKAGARVDVDSYKRNPHDFVLWFTRSKFEDQAMMWDSPWGRGYPGWHVECSAMSMHYLGEHFDIHCGGIDHIPVHHTNEIAQAEGATGVKYVNYWLHNEFLVMDKGKMSKSAGGFLTLDSLVERGYHPLDYRYFCLLAHYRSELHFSWEALDAGRVARTRIVDRVRRLSGEAGGAAGGAAAPGRSAAEFHAESHASTESVPDSVQPYIERFTAALEDDLNSSKAISELWGLLKDSSVGAADALAGALRMDSVLGLGLLDSLTRADGPLDAELDALLEERREARKRKDFARADEIRDTLREHGIVIEDGPDGPRWKRVDA